MPASVKPYISRFDKAFREDSSRNYHLTIRLAPDGFSFVVFWPEKNRYIGIEAYRFHQADEGIKLAAALDEVIMVKEWISYPFQSVLVLIAANSNTLIPEALYDEKEKGVYLAFNQQFKDNSRIVTDHLKSAAAFNVYYLSNSLIEKIKDIWANARIVHFSSVFAESLLIANRNQNIDNVVFIHVHGASFEMLVIRNNKLQFLNQFRFLTPEDFVYFILFSFDQLRLNPENAQLILSGEIFKGSEHYEILWKYIRNIGFSQRVKAFEYSYVLEELPVHQHAVLYNAQLCEL